MSNPLAELSILLNLHISQWTGEVSDTRALGAVAKAFKGNTDRDKYRKSLFISDPLGPIHKAAGRIRTHFYRKTLVWSDGGSRLVPSMDFQDFGKEHSGLVSEFEQYVDAFVSDYPELQEDAKNRKGDLYRESDYPSVDIVRDKFSVSLLALPFPDTNDFRIRAPEEVIAELRLQMDASLSEITNTVAGDIRARIHARLNMLRDGLASGKRFSQTLFDEMTLVTDMGYSMQEILPIRLIEAIDTLRADVLCFTADQVRNSESMKVAFIVKCDDLLKII